MTVWQPCLQSQRAGVRAAGRKWTHSAGLLLQQSKGPPPAGGLSGLSISPGLKAIAGRGPRGPCVGLSDCGRPLQMFSDGPGTRWVPTTDRHFALGSQAPSQGGGGQQDGAWSTQSNAHLPHENLSNPEPNSRATTCDESHLVPERKTETLYRGPCSGLP